MLCTSCRWRRARCMESALSSWVRAMAGRAKTHSCARLRTAPQRWCVWLGTLTRRWPCTLDKRRATRLSRQRRQRSGVAFTKRGSWTSAYHRRQGFSHGSHTPNRGCSQIVHAAFGHQRVTETLVHLYVRGVVLERSDAATSMPEAPLRESSGGDAEKDLRNSEEKTFSKRWLFRRWNFPTTPHVAVPHSL